ncbi:MAG: carbohydrate binding domain-containing protein [Spirochaetales bacterium]|nr:carbohydrate binding domain-containing protein [Spirochaetales bacterium]
MFRKSVLFILGILLFSPVNTAVFGQTSIDLPYKHVDITSINGKADFKGTGLYGKPGQPNLPFYTVTFLVPESTDLSKVTAGIENLSESELEGTYTVEPALPPTIRGEIAWPGGLDIVDGKDVAVYGKNTYFPVSCRGPVVTGKLRQYKIVEATVYPVRYNPVTGKLKTITSGVLTLYGLPAANTKGILPLSPVQPEKGSLDEKIKQQLEKIIINDADIGQYPLTAARSAASASVTYVIITTEAISSSSSQLANFITHKELLGFNVILATEGTWGGGTGDTASDRIRDWLKTSYLSRNIAYALLIGNPDTGTGDIPMKMSWPRSYADTDRNAPTDFYYAELSGNWDANGNGVFGEGDDLSNVIAGGADKYAEIAVGRIPYYGNTDDLDHILAKTIAYENSSDTAWRRNILLPMKPSDASTPGFQLGEAIKNNYASPAGFASHRVYDEINSYSGLTIEDVLALDPPVETMPCTELNVTDAWKNKPFGTVIWWTHGWSQGASSIMSSTGALTLNDNYPAFTFQVSCNNSEPEISSNLSYTLLKNGAIATVGATRVSWYWIGESVFTRETPSTSNAGMSHSYAGYLIEEGMPCGHALNALKAASEPYGMWMNWVDFNIYGDPSVGLGEIDSPGEKQAVFAVNAGGDAYTANDGTVYSADTNFTGGSTAATTAAINGTDDDALYQSERWGACSYSVPGLENGTYELKFQFAETYWTATNARVFDVAVEGGTVMDNLDIVDNAGYNTAYDFVKKIELTDGELNIAFTGATVDQPKISAFAVYRLVAQNVPPVANAGPDQNANVQTPVQLDASGSYDPDNGPQPLTYSWEWQYGQPDSQTAPLNNPTAMNPVFTPLYAGSYSLKLTVSDGTKASIDYVMIKVTSVNVAPVPVIGGDKLKFAIVNQPLTLDASGSYDPDSSPASLSYRWYVYASSCGIVTLSSLSSSVTTFTATGTGSATIGLTLSDGEAYNYGYVNILVEESTASPVVAVNCGGGDYTATNGTVYSADNYFTGGEAAVTASPIDATEDDVLYRTERWGTSSYAIPLPNARYRVKIQFAETYWDAAAQRSFEVNLEGRTINSQFDIFAAAGGKNRAYDMAQYADVTDGVLNINFQNPTADQPKINAFVVYSFETTPSIQLPGRIEAENYRDGGEGAGYHDLTPGNLGGQYRTDSVDIEATTDAGAGYNVGWIDSGEWLAYDVDVAATGTYRIEARVASGVTGTKQLSVLIDGQNAVSGLAFSNADGWQAWTTITSQDISLTAGKHELKAVMTAGGFNLNYIDVVAPANAAPVANAGPDQAVTVNNTVILDGSGSYDPDNGPGPLTYAWKVEQAAGAVTMSSTTANRPTFTPTAIGDYTFSLMTSDGALGSEKDTVVIHVRQAVSPNLVKNGDFASGNTDWTAFTQTPEAAATHTFVNGTYKAVITNAGQQTWHISLSQPGVNLENGKKYTLSFDARTTSGIPTLEALLQREGGDWALYSPVLTPQITTSWQNFSVDFMMTAGSDPNARLQFSLGNQGLNTIELDNISVKEID